MNLLVPFLTGLTAGGLNCLAVQGALLASTLAYQVELDMHSQSANQKFRPRLAQPIILFLSAKLVAYTLLGFLAGGLGSFFMLTPMTRAVLMVAIGIFMLGNGLRMLKVHPIFRYFVIEPPASLTRYIRRKSKNGASIFTPIFMGTLTVLLPCGISQSMIALALGTGNPYQGAAILFAFTLGTIPVFFGVSYFATRLGASMEKYFNRFVAIVIIILAFVSINSGLNLAGSPYSFTNLFMGGRVAAVDQAQDISPASSPAEGYVITVKDEGYFPKVLHLAANKPVKLAWVTEDVHSCALSVVVPALNYQKILPSTGKVAFDIPAQAKGTVIRYSCSMGMYTGQYVFDLE